MQNPHEKQNTSLRREDVNADIVNAIFDSVKEIERTYHKKHRLSLLTRRDKSMIDALVSGCTKAYNNEYRSPYAKTAKMLETLGFCLTNQHIFEDRHAIQSIYELTVLTLRRLKDAEWERRYEQGHDVDRLMNSANFAIRRIAEKASYSSNQEQAFCKCWDVASESTNYPLWTQILNIPTLDFFAHSHWVSKVTHHFGYHPDSGANFAFEKVECEFSPKQICEFRDELEIWTAKNIQQLLLTKCFDLLKAKSHQRAVTTDDIAINQLVQNYKFLNRLLLNVKCALSTSNGSDYNEKMNYINSHNITHPGETDDANHFGNELSRNIKKMLTALNHARQNGEPIENLTCEFSVRMDLNDVTVDDPVKVAQRQKGKIAAAAAAEQAPLFAERLAKATAERKAQEEKAKREQQPVGVARFFASQYDRKRYGGVVELTKAQRELLDERDAKSPYNIL